MGRAVGVPRVGRVGHRRVTLLTFNERREARPHYTAVRATTPQRPSDASHGLFRLIGVVRWMAPRLRRLRSYGPCRGASSNGVEKPGPGADRRGRTGVAGGAGALTVAVRIPRGNGRVC